MMAVFPTAPWLAKKIQIRWIGLVMVESFRASVYMQWYKLFVFFLAQPEPVVNISYCLLHDTYIYIYDYKWKYILSRKNDLNNVHLDPSRFMYVSHKPCAFTELYVPSSHCINTTATRFAVFHNRVVDEGRWAKHGLMPWMCVWIT